MAQVKEFLHEQQDEMPLPVTDPDYEAWFRRKVARSIEAADNGQLLHPSPFLPLPFAVASPMI